MVAPFAGLMLADQGASVLRVDRTTSHASKLPPPPTADNLTRRKASITVDLKSPAGIDFIRRLIPHTDVLIEPFRPGVLEKLGLGPDVLLKLNPRLIIGRMTGFRRDGKYKDMAGHDINYIAVSGALSMLGGKHEKPTPPINILGDFAGGGAILFQGILLALLHRERTGRGQVVEANMVDGSAYLATFPRFAVTSGLFDHPRGENMLDGGCPWYDTYPTKDGKFVAVGALEPQFFAALITGLGLAGKGYEKSRSNRRNWPEIRNVFQRLFLEKTRAEWEAVFDGTDACVTPVLEVGELHSNPGLEGDQRPAVTLRESPGLAIQGGQSKTDPSRGQGSGVQGDGWVAYPLRPGEGGEEVLREWTGWRKEKHYDEANGGLVVKNTAKL